MLSLMVMGVVLAAAVGLLVGWVHHARRRRAVAEATEKAQSLKAARDRRLARRAETDRSNWTAIHHPPAGQEKRPVVLLVDAQEERRVRLKRVLEDYAYRVVLAEDGKRAWAALQLPDQRPDVIITDIEMPYFTGLQLLRLVRQDIGLAEIPALLMTRRAPEAWNEEKSSGATGLLTPGFSNEELVGQVQFVLQE